MISIGCEAQLSVMRSAAYCVCSTAGRKHYNRETAKPCSKVVKSPAEAIRSTAVENSMNNSGHPSQIAMVRTAAQDMWMSHVLLALRCQQNGWRSPRAATLSPYNRRNILGGHMAAAASAGKRKSTVLGTRMEKSDGVALEP